MTVETQYFTTYTHTINGLLAYKLWLTTSVDMAENDKTASYDLTTKAGIRVWKRASDGTETEITDGEPMAEAVPTRGVAAEYDGIWLCPVTTLLTTDAIVVRIYGKLGANPWVLFTTFITEQLGTTILNAAYWTVHYWLYEDYYGRLTHLAFWWGDATYISRITNFTYGVAAAVMVSKRLLVGVGL
jgi:hypothetical protein